MDVFLEDIIAPVFIIMGFVWLLVFVVGKFSDYNHEVTRKERKQSARVNSGSSSRSGAGKVFTYALEALVIIGILAAIGGTGVPLIIIFAVAIWMFS